MILLLALLFTRLLSDQAHGAVNAYTNVSLHIVLSTCEGVASDRVQRLSKSISHFGISKEVIVMDCSRSIYLTVHPPGDHKVLSLRETIEEDWKQRDDILILYISGFDSLVVSDSVTIIEHFLEFSAKVVFSSEPECWPDPSLELSYPRVAMGNRFLNSKAFIGYAPVIYSMINDNPISQGDNDQLYYTRIFIDEEKRMKYGIKIDSRSHIFHTLNGGPQDSHIELIFNDFETHAINRKYNNVACVIHGNERSKELMNYLSSYIPNQWNRADGCVHCLKNELSLPSNESQWPTVTIGLFVNQPTPFIDVVLLKLRDLHYPKSLITIKIYNKIPYHDKHLLDWLQEVDSLYCDIELITSKSGLSEAKEIQAILDRCMSVTSTDCDYYLHINSTGVLDNPKTLLSLIRSNKNVISPLLAHPELPHVTNVRLTSKHSLHQEVLTYKKKGIWPAVSVDTVVLLKGSWLSDHSKDLVQYCSSGGLGDRWLTDWMQMKGHIMYVDNLHNYGHLLITSSYELHHLHNDLYNIFENRMDWELKYLHPNYLDNVMNNIFQQPCNDVFRFPLVSQLYAKELIEELEHYGRWSDGKNADSRINGGYEPVPTRDIHMNQIGFETQWCEIVHNYILPIQRRLFIGYQSKGHCYLNFVVKYTPRGQSSLKPHHDSSTFTVNIALTKYGIDHQGGGCRFIRQGCSVVDTEVGWAIMHPGRLTHLHEGLETTNGTRYIMVSFIDPCNISKK